MDIIEAAKRKYLLEKEISRLLEEFTQETDLQVGGVLLHPHQYFEMGKREDVKRGYVVEVVAKL